MKRVLRSREVETGPVAAPKRRRTEQKAKISFKYEEKSSEAKDRVNKAFVHQVRNLPGKDHHIVLLDGPNMETSRALIAAGTRPELITVVEMDDVTHQAHRESALGVKLAHMDIFSFLDEISLSLPSTGNLKSAFPTVVYADLMDSSSFLMPKNLSAMYNWRDLCGRLAPHTGKEFMCVYTVSARGRVLSPVHPPASSMGEIKKGKAKPVTVNHVGDRFTVLGRFLYDFHGAREDPQGKFSLFWQHGYRRDPKSQTMHQAWFKSNVKGEPFYTPRELGKRVKGVNGEELVLVYYYGYPNPSVELLDGDAAQSLLAAAKIRDCE